jgi:hypothetical protein
MSWQTTSGMVAVVWNVIDPTMVDLTDYLPRITDATIIA